MQTKSKNVLEHTEQQSQSILDQRGYWRAITTDTHPDECDHPADARIRYGRSDVSGCPFLEETCTDCGLRTDKALDTTTEVLGP